MSTIAKERTLHFGVGECGSNIVEHFKKEGFKTIAYNTATADLNRLKLTTDKRIIGSTEGSGKDRRISSKSFDENINNIKTSLQADLNGIDMAFVYTSTAGGTGSGTALKLATEIKRLGKKVVVMAVRPLKSEVGKSQNNDIAFIGDYERVKNDISIVPYENKVNVNEVNQYIFDCLNNLFHPVGQPLNTLDFRDVVNSFRKGYNILATGKTKEIIVESMFDTKNAKTAFLVAVTPQNFDGYGTMEKNSFGLIDRNYYEYRSADSPSWTILLGELNTPEDVIKDLVESANKNAMALNQKSMSLNIGLVEID